MRDTLITVAVDVRVDDQGLIIPCKRNSLSSSSKEISATDRIRAGASPLGDVDYKKKGVLAPTA